MAKRKGITKKARFEVFKRDSFKCQYCGASAPDVVLEVDHIHPVSKGGKNDTLNLVTSCWDCNRGKSDRKLDDNSVVEVQREQLNELNEKRQQLEMMITWRDSLQDIENDKVSAIEAAINPYLSDMYINDNGLKDIKRWVKKYDFKLILECIDIGADQYLETNENGSTNSDSFEKFFRLVPRIAHHKTHKTALADNIYKDAFYCRGILRNRLRYIDEVKCIRLLKTCVDLGIDMEGIKASCKSYRNWSEFEEDISLEIEVQDA